MDKRTFDEVADGLRALCGDMSRVPNFRNIAHEIETTLDKNKDPLLIMIMGEFSTGKSTFINALMKKNIVKVGATPTTSVITKLSYGATDKIEVVFRDGTRKNYSASEFENLTAELESKDSNHSKYNSLHEQIAYVSRTVPAEILKNMTLIDCPGLNSIYDIHEKTTREFMDKADTVIWLFETKNPAKQSEFTAFKKLNPRINPVVIVNKTDMVDEEEDGESVESIIADIERKLRNNHLKAQKIIGISAKLAFQGIQQNNSRLISASNIDEFYNFINNSVLNNRELYQQNSIFEEIAYLLYNYELPSNCVRMLTKILDTLSAYERKVSTLSVSESLLLGVFKLRFLGPRDAVKYFRKAAESGNAFAIANIGDMYYSISDYSESFKWFKKAADNSDTDSYHWLGIMYRNGEGVTQNYSEAFKWFNKGADNGNINSYSWLGMMYRNGEGVTQNYSEALKWFNKGADNGDKYSYSWLGMMYYHGEGVTQNYSESFKWFKKAADNGNINSYSWLGMMYRNGEGVTQNYSEALKWFNKGADNGNTDSYYWLGIMYRNGEGVTQNYSEAFKWFKKAADNGDTRAYYWIGRMYYRGEGVTKDYYQAIKWFKKAADNGDTDSYSWLGVMYYRGEGVTENYSEAFKWFNKGADNGNTDSYSWIGRMYYRGEGVTKDYYQAIKWFKKDAENGSSSSMYYIAEIYRYGGTNVSQDYDEALRWYQKAINAGNSQARIEKESLEREIARARSVSTYSSSSSDSYSGSGSSSRRNSGVGGMAAGAVIGGLIGGPIGALIGGWIGNNISKD